MVHATYLKPRDVITNAPVDRLFPFQEPFHLHGQDLTAEQIIDQLKPAMSETRVKRMQQVCAQRTFDIVPIMEGLYDIGNIAAVARSCDGTRLAGIALHLVLTAAGAFCLAHLVLCDKQ